MFLFKMFENIFTLITCIVGLVFMGGIWGSWLVSGGDFWAMIGGVSSFLSLLWVLFIYGQWKEQLLATKRLDEYHECSVLLGRFFNLSLNLIEIKKREYWFLSQNQTLTPYDICNELVGSNNGNRNVIEARNALIDMNLEVIYKRELLSALLGGSANDFLRSFEIFRAITFSLANSNYEVLKVVPPSKAELIIQYPSTYSTFDDSKFKSVLDNWGAKSSSDMSTIEFCLNDYSKLHEDFKDLISSFRDDFHKLSIRYIQNII